MRTLLVMIVGLGIGWAQTPPKHDWEVTSVKLNPECGGRRMPSPPPAPGRLSQQCQTVESLILMAYVVFPNGTSPTLKRIPISGGPAWVRSEYYAINAKAEDAAPVAQMMGPMLQSLLEERFHLKIRREQKEGPVFIMTVAKGGSKLQPMKEGSCVPLDVNHLPNPKSGEPMPNICGNQQVRMIDGRRVSIHGTGLSMKEFSSGMLSDLLGRPVIDQTGLAGKFDIALEVARDSTLAMFQETGRGDADANGAPIASDPEGPNILQALEKLGLRLEAGKGPVDTLVIDHVERPSGN